MKVARNIATPEEVEKHLGAPFGTRALSGGEVF
jgi:hypothetical protein